MNAHVYTGRKAEEPVHPGLTKDVVMWLCEPYYNPGREIVTDNFFISHGLAVYLHEKNLTLFGTLRSNRIEVPHALRNKKRPVESCQFVYERG